MASKTEALPVSIHSLEERADRDLAIVEGLTSKKVSRKYSKNARDARDTRDTATDSALNVPDTAGHRRDTMNAPRFELVEGGGRVPGVYWIDVAKDRDGTPAGEAPPVWICSPLRVEAMTRDPQNSEWGRLLVFTDRDHQEHRWCMPMKMLAGSGEDLRAVLLAEGLSITSNPSQRRLVSDYIQRACPDTIARCVTRTGWHGYAFALPRETFGDSKNEPVLFQSASLDGVALGQKGTLEGWLHAVAAPLAGNSRLVMALSAAFAGPCLGLLKLDGGGLHLRGGSSTGKSTALAVAASFYGSPAFARTWRQTDNALEGIAALHSDLLLILDEIGQLDPRHAGQVAYLLANGQGKGRSQRDGSPRALATWRVLFLSAGEVGLSDLVVQGGGKVRAGQEVRVIDLPADAGAGLGLFEAVPDGLTPAAFANALKDAAGNHYGHALPAFLRELVADPARARVVLQRLRDDLTAQLAPANADGQVRRVADRFALIAAAGELATVFGLTGWETGEAEWAAKTCFDAWLAGRGTTGAAEPAAMLAQVRRFFDAHSESRFSPWEAHEGAPRTNNRAGFRKAGERGPTFYVDREAFRHEVCAGFDHLAVARVLIDCGALVTGSGGESTRKERLPDGRHTRVYCIGPKLWGDE